MSRTGHIPKAARCAAAIAGLALLSAPGALRVAFVPPDAISMRAAVLATTAGAGCAALLFVCQRATCDLPTWCLAVSAASLAALLPVANESAPNIETAYAALFGVSLAVAVFRFRPTAGRASAAAALTAGAIALDPTSSAWALGWAWASLAARRVQAAVVAAAAVAAGLLIRLLANGIGVARTGPDPFAVRDDLTLLMPVALVGGIGLASMRRCHAVGARPAWLAAWVGASIAGVFAALLGLPATVPVLLLPFWWTAPFGLLELSRMLFSARSSRLSRICAAVVLVMTVALGAPAARRWLEGIAIALYSVLPAG